MAWHLIDTKALPEPMQAYNYWESKQQIWCKFNENVNDIISENKSILTENHIIICYCFQTWISYITVDQGERFENTYELLNLRALKYSPVN